MKHKIGDTVEIFKTKEKTKVVNLQGRKKLYVDIYDGTVGSI